ncbi:MAG: hypothetical protein CVV64_07110 [Candidatus Wallbacteria bacterium HGW-Wallbacteria-1]|jgi:peptide/nickel transport system substrate-binding protein|uniref:Solute-binding protein family 5 domain-containing protein n=1 Tax=Candidatus Wallbacteria bacterium HGW-Wallbacteria-1 TaxID=2013854 RepID=A0A2N1PT48_9BACT|nr:MAG: hypothetical protein CVV64_07110 [Candidatus Wallbacteria bacterium HGW-Wallbacteria-1]
MLNKKKTIDTLFLSIRKLSVFSVYGSIAALIICISLTGCGSQEKVVSPVMTSDFVDKDMGEPGVWLETPHNFIPTPGDTLTECVLTDPDFLNPVISLRESAKKAEELLFDTILQYDEDLKITPSASESWTFSKEGLTITFILRDDIFFHPVLKNDKIIIPAQKATARDVKFTVDQILLPENRSPYRSFFSNLESLRVFDDRTFQVEYRDIRGTNLTAWTTVPILPQHIYGKISPLYKSPYLDTPVGSGPFMFSSWIRGKELTLVKWERYWEGAPLLNSYVMKVIPDKSYQYQLLLQQKIDVMELTLEQFTQLAESDTFSKNYRKIALYSKSYEYVGYNLVQGPEFFTDPEVRRAMTMAIDRDRLIRTVYKGMASKITGPTHIYSWGYDNYIEPLPYDPEQAIAILEKQGWEAMDPDNVRYKIIGGKKIRLDFKLMTHAENNLRREFVQMIREDLQKVGFLVRPWIIDNWELLVKKFLIPKKFDAYVLGWDLGNEPDIFSVWHSSESKFGLNHIGFTDRDVDGWLEKFRDTTDQKERQIGSWRIHKLIHEKQPYTFLLSPRKLIAVHRRFKNLRVSKTAYSLFPLNYRQWFAIQDEKSKK